MSNYWDPKFALKADIMYQPLHEFRNNGLSVGIDLGYDTAKQCPWDKDRTEQIFEKLFPGRLVPENIAPLMADYELGNPTRHQIKFMVDSYQKQAWMTGGSISNAYRIKDILDYLPKMRGGGVIWEIGPGYGGLARNILLSRKVHRMYLQDFEIHTALQKYYLQDFNNITYIQANEKLHPKVDFVINVHSMMEMDRVELYRYIHNINRIVRPGGYFYQANFNKPASVLLQDYPLDSNWEQIYTKPQVDLPTPGGYARGRLYRRLG